MIKLAPEPVPSLKIYGLRILYGLAQIAEGLLTVLSLSLLRPSVSWSLWCALEVSRARALKQSMPLRDFLEEANHEVEVEDQNDDFDEVVTTQEFIIDKYIDK